ncbi:MAG: 16S rRNA (cytosine(1402)-N(4))-methyltransferase RsmH [Desulfarculus sp.]|nr:16S rRNA (cytosine(1402)-N(4))-methyltransferase RsmH [Desulfarculus sp.]
MTAYHRPVMLAEVLGALRPRAGGVYVDGTLGAGGHAAAILEASAPDGCLVGLDRDPLALALAQESLSPFGERVRLIRSTFDRLPQHLAQLGLTGADGLLLDLGVSSMQLDQAARGFAFRHDAPLDMRMAPEGETAAQLLARLEENELAGILARLGEEPFARRIARALVKARQAAPIASTGQLARLVEEALPAAVRRQRAVHPATQTFQALRLHLNDELGQLERFLAAAPSLLNPGGRLAVISYHSLEDRRVKKAFAAYAHPCTCPPRLPRCQCGRLPLFTPLYRKALRPSPQEVQDNPRARSARLRAVARTEAAA